MAIGYARLEYAKRSEGKNACAKSAYNSRGTVRFEGTKFKEAQSSDCSNKEKPASHEVILPEHIDKRFKNPEVLWNAAEQAEKRNDSQVCTEEVLALADDKEISLEDRIEMVRMWVRENYTSKGFGVQVDIHQPA